MISVKTPTKMILLILLPLLTVVDASCSCAGSTGQGNCPDLNTVVYGSFPDLAKRPIYLKFSNSTRYQNVDSVCYTVDCLPDGSDFYLLYAVTVYNDSSTSITTSIQSITQASQGLYMLSSASRYTIQYTLGPTSQQTNVVFDCDECGQDPESYSLGSSNSYGQMSDEELAEAKSILAAQNLDSPNVTPLPMTQGPQCYYTSCTYCQLSASSCSSNVGNTDTGCVVS